MAAHSCGAVTDFHRLPVHSAAFSVPLRMVSNPRSIPWSRRNPERELEIDSLLGRYSCAIRMLHITHFRNAIGDRHDLVRSISSRQYNVHVPGTRLKSADDFLYRNVAVA